MSEIVLASYLPKAGKETEVEKLIKKHALVLKELGLTTDRPQLTFKSQNGAYVEVIEWVDASSAEKAHEHPAVAQVWEALEVISQFKKIADLPESATPFSHFKVVDHLSETFT